MTQSQVTFTALTNIDARNVVIDNEKVYTKRYDSYNDTFKMTASGREDRTDTLINVSVYDDVVYFDGVPSKIIIMRTKSKELWDEEDAAA